MNENREAHIVYNKILIGELLARPADIKRALRLLRN